MFRAEGPRASHLFRHEPGGHRWQRVPPNEKKDRIQTSTVTVAVLREPAEAEWVPRPSELEWRTTKGSGPGGQHRNKTESAVILTHLPSGLTVRCEAERSQHRNRELALRLLRARWLAQAEQGAAAQANATRRQQTGTGMRGDKVRTVRERDGQVTDHRTGHRLRLEDYRRGSWGPLSD
ncbi:peptide chain release factor-like protein [Pyxidicoccus xibeiensis]|uniref:peptide chain release factor-like protein n=1 Tax=Pyxidicoccus xibeiensis TaxID=2906759 RepID=UPI0020A6E52D|nr:peptide chain release factor-like protein [Pyxidicoccus xibeiensis]MCP3136957.1 PCRF domain-containing protein [Pyxidicoccus xibeiensis]